MVDSSKNHFYDRRLLSLPPPKSITHSPRESLCLPPFKPILCEKFQNSISGGSFSSKSESQIRGNSPTAHQLHRRWDSSHRIPLSKQKPPVMSPTQTFRPPARNVSPRNQVRPKLARIRPPQRPLGLSPRPRNAKACMPPPPATSQGIPKPTTQSFHNYEWHQDRRRTYPEKKAQPPPSRSFPRMLRSRSMRLTSSEQITKKKPIRPPRRPDYPKPRINTYRSSSAMCLSPASFSKSLNRSTV